MPAFLFLNPLNWSFLYCEPIVTFKIVAVSFPLVSDTFAFAPATKYLCFKEKEYLICLSMRFLNFYVSGLKLGFF